VRACGGGSPLGNKAVRDHEGRAWPSVSAMCRAWGTTCSAYSHRVKAGWTVEEALTLPARPGSPRSARCEDHTGRRFPNPKDMCLAWGVSPQAFYRRRKAGWTVEEALTTPPDPERSANQLSGALLDPDGREWPSVAAMCRAWGVPRTRFYSRVEAGWTVEEALALPAGSRPGRPALDPDGREWPSAAAMCRAWGTTLAAYRRALDAGLTAREALEARTNPRGL
jgi:hypothetical protein